MLGGNFPSVTQIFPADTDPFQGDQRNPDDIPRVISNEYEEAAKLSQITGQARCRISSTTCGDKKARAPWIQNTPNTQSDFRFAAFRKAGKLIDKISWACADERRIPSPHTLSAT